MPLFCFSPGGEGDNAAAFFGLRDKIIRATPSLTHSPTPTPPAVSEYLFPPAQQHSTLISLALSSDGRHLLGVFSCKAAVCWDTSSGAVQGSATVHKKPTALLCSSLPHSLTGSTPSTPSSFALVSEKGGEVWAYPLPSLGKAVKLLGHTSSVITDMTMCVSECGSGSGSGSGSRIVTADRDEKIRLTTFPETSTIFGYCLGHTDVVTSTTVLSLTPQSSSAPLLLSAGWDHRVCLWNTQTCTQLDVIALAPEQEQEKEKEQEQPVPDHKVDEEDESAADKVYDETKAGHFPLRVVAQPAGGDTFAVLFWNKPEISLYRVQQSGSSAEFVKNNGEVAATVIALPAPPVDCVFVDEGKTLLALLPAPHYWLSLSLSGAPAPEGPWTSVVKQFSDAAAQNGRLNFNILFDC